jgi:hypothetical protein
MGDKPQFIKLIGVYEKDNEKHIFTFEIDQVPRRNRHRGNDIPFGARTGPEW